MKVPVNIRKWTPLLLVIIATGALAYFYLRVEMKRIDVEKNELEGRWDLRSAQRDGRYTNTLENLYFNFRADGTMETNLFGQSRDFTYEYGSNEIRQSGERTITYNIDALKDSLMVMRTTIREYEFTFELVKREE